ncbi:hypothetical protein J2Z35_001178 [Acetoanaerobium pronyense]|uniref:Uncharacterized protein n=1 Tax=Acetoanaerobium pronyense TaxID=1482736 RepID=A0ABS4KHY9_9FIRM|nr:hypothetical protein [Acetoanaerobium pronyense]MBP2027384.1 hypothetical protein [Acetoanaerobium pronyense]
MNLINEFKMLFQTEDLSISERVKVLELKVSIDKGSIPDFSDIINLGKNIADRDKCIIEFNTIIEDHLRLVLKEPDESEYESFIDDLKDYEDSVLVILTIEKTIMENSFSIYCFKEFTKDLLNKSIVDIMSLFGLLLNRAEYLVFEIYDSDIFFSTQTMFFVNRSSHNITLKEINRSERISECKDISYFYNNSNLNLLPEDFKIVTSYDNNPYEEIFDKLVSILSLVYISTLATIEDDVLKVQISGQRNVDFSYELNRVMIHNPILFKIYSWIYNGGNLIDKALIARNILSLHCKYTNLINTDEKTYATIQSNFNLYLKDNVNQYLDLKNKVSEYICSVTTQVGDNVLSLFNNFKTNLLTLITFLFSVIIINIVSDNPLDNIFTRDIILILELILLGSIIYLLISISENKYRLKKIKSGYQVLKDSYNEILSNQDLEDIFKEDKAIKNAIKEVEDGTKKYMILWVGFILLSLSLLEFISSEPPISNFIKDIFKNIISLRNLLVQYYW